MMEFTESELKLLEAARKIPGSAATRLWFQWACFALIVVGVLLKVAADFSLNDVVIGLLIIGFYAMMIEYLRFKGRALILLNKLAMAARSDDLSAFSAFSAVQST